MPQPLDEYPIHQLPLPIGRVGTSDRNFYDRWYFNGHDRSGELFLIAGMGFYPNLEVKDGYVCLKQGDALRVLRVSDRFDVSADDRLSPGVGPLQIEVVEPLRRIRLRCEGAGDGGDLRLDLTWQGSFPAIDESRHLLRTGPRAIVDSWRFAQVGSWSGLLTVDGTDIEVSPDTWVGTRDRSWGIRPIGDPEPPGRPPAGDFGFWWLYVPLRFERFAVVLVLQEDGAGHRTLNDAVRVHPDGSDEQLGWPRVRIHYRPGSRHPESAEIDLTEPDGSPLRLSVDTLGFVPLHVGCGYGGDPEWLHGQWRGAGWTETVSYDLTDPAVAARVPWGVVDHVARGRIGDDIGWGLFEHGTIGRHLPSGFADLVALAQ